jgi:hypothetical protein
MTTATIIPFPFPTRSFAGCVAMAECVGAAPTDPAGG